MESTQEISCCPAGSHVMPASSYTDCKGTMSTLTVNGTEVRCYEVGPKDAKTVFVFVHNILDMDAGRCKERADFLADQGFRVLFPDMHKGDPVAKSPSDDIMSKLPAWLDAHPVAEVVAMMRDAIVYVSGEDKKVIGVGFCWGNWVLYHCQKAGIALDGCVCLHPSLTLEDRLGGDHNELLKSQNCPVMVAAAGNDAPWTKPGAEWEQSAKALGFEEKSKFYDFPDMKHGWTCSVDTTDEKIKRDVDITF